MPELIDKYAAYKALKHEAETHEFYESEVAYNHAARIIDQMPTIPDIDRAAIMRLCNEIEDIACHIGNTGARMDLRTPTEVQLDEADSVMMGGADNG